MLQAKNTFILCDPTVYSYYLTRLSVWLYFSFPAVFPGIKPEASYLINVQCFPVLEYPFHCSLQCYTVKRLSEVAS